MTRPPALVLALALVACGRSASDAPPPPAASQPATRPPPTTLAGPEPLRDAFVRAAGRPRLLLFLSPT